LTIPSCIFPSSVAFSDKSFDRSFIAKLINHTKYLLKNQLKADEMCINLIQIFRQMVYYNYYPVNNKITEELRRNLLDKYLERKETSSVNSELEKPERRISLESLRNNLLAPIKNVSGGENVPSGKLFEKKKDECDEMKRHRVQCDLNDLGASDLVIDLFTSEISNNLFKESVLLAIALLEGGNNQVQVRFKR
jgi:inositol 1,4,5-triphosphate receptor type 1